MTMTAPVDAGPTGYSLPLSPTGAASMLTPPPWHFSGDVIMVDYRVDPEAAARFLPPGLTLGSDPGAAAAIFAEWQWCSESGAELGDPQQCQFAEFLILLACEHNGVAMARCPYAWVDNPVPMMRGWVQGMPKQFGAIHQTRPKTVGLAGPRPNAPGRFDGALSVHGRRVAEITVHTERQIEQPPPLHTVPLVHTRVFPTWTSAAPPLAQLVTSEVTGVEFGEIWAGDADLRFPSAPDPDFAGLLPVEIDQGYVFSYAETLCGGKLLGEA